MTYRDDRQGSIFDVYPDAPGYKREGTSQEAAQSMKSRAATLREMVMQELAKAPGTADELAKRLGQDKLSIRPRCSELFKEKRIVETGEFRKNDSGINAIVWGLP